MVDCDDKVQPGQNKRCSPAAGVRHGGGDTKTFSISKKEQS